ncbi:hypothetical protein ACFVRD_33080 [Streptomyces sp. NPDC057908]|uniref:hypothetical protein n=1 Tax=Streptomyces sp. NPDC057908 TaxID=3346276 RepID=UPI0036E45F1D
MTDIDRTIPASLVELAQRAVRSGRIDKVSLGFEGLGADFPAPIGWIMHLNRVETTLAAQLGISDVGNHLMATSQIGSEPRAFVGIDRPMMDAEAITAWIALPRPTDSGEPIADFGDAEMLITAVRNGWSVQRELGRADHMIMSRHAPAEMSDRLPLRASYQLHALNNFYNVEDTPSHRSTGAPVSRSIFLRRDAVPASPWVSAMAEGTRISPESAITEISVRAPWYADVAYFDEDTETWIL